MATKGASYGMLNYFIPSRHKAGFKVPTLLHKLAAHWDGSCWLYDLSVDEQVRKIMQEFSTEGARFHRVVFQPRDEDELREIIRESLNRTIGHVSSSLKASVKKLSEKFEEMDTADADGKVVDLVRKATKRLEDAMTVVASFALTEDYEDLRSATASLVEGELVDARTKLAKVFQKKVKEMEKAEA